jgi:hypothetical protein
MKNGRMNAKGLTRDQIAELDALNRMPDSEIDFSDIPRQTEKDFERGFPFRDRRKFIDKNGRLKKRSS